MLFIFSFFLSAIILMSIILLTIKYILINKSITYSLIALNFLCFFLLYVRLTYIIETFINPNEINFVGISNEVAIENKSTLLSFYFFPIYSMFLYSTIWNLKRLIIIHLPLILIISLQIILTYKLNLEYIIPLLGFKLLNWSIACEIIYLIIFLFKYISIRKLLTENLRAYIIFLILIFIYVIFTLVKYSFPSYSALINNNNSIIIFNLIIVMTGGWIMFHPRIMSGDVFWESKVIDEYTRSHRKLFLLRWDMEKISKNTKALTILDLEKNENSFLFKKLNEIVTLENKYIHSEIKLSKTFDDFLVDNFNQKKIISIKIFFGKYLKLTQKKYIKQLNTIRAKKLIENGFLKSNSTSDLAKECGFNNRISLFNNFIKTFGYPPTQIKTSK